MATESEYTPPVILDHRGNPMSLPEVAPAPTWQSKSRQRWKRMAAALLTIITIGTR